MRDSVVVVVLVAVCQTCVYVVTTVLEVRFALWLSAAGKRNRVAANRSKVSIVKKLLNAQPLHEWYAASR